jgi:hypothetical protein
MTVAAVGGRYPVRRREVSANPNSRSLLADIEMEESRGLALPAGDLGDAFESTEEEHPLIECEHLRPVERRFDGLVTEAMD